MKKGIFYVLVAVATFAPITLSAQDLEADSTQFLFDGDGSFTRVTTSPQDIAAKIIRVNPLVDDVVWRKAVLRVVDLRERQNNPLYYPYEDLDSLGQKNLFAIMFQKVITKQLQAFKSPSNPEQTFIPKFNKENYFDVDEFIQANGLSIYETPYDMINFLSQGVVKYYVQEVWYFNKRTSTFHSKILAIAPLYDEKYNSRSDIRTGVWFWIPFERLRPYLQEEFMKISGRNTAPLVNFDDFLVSRQFDSYIMKDYDLLSRDVDKGLDEKDPNTVDVIRREQKRVEEEILNFEQDLWHY